MGGRLCLVPHSEVVLEQAVALAGVVCDQVPESVGVRTLLCCAEERGNQHRLPRTAFPEYGNVLLSDSRIRHHDCDRTLPARQPSGLACADRSASHLSASTSRTDSLCVGNPVQLRSRMHQLAGQRPRSQISRCYSCRPLRPEALAQVNPDLSVVSDSRTDRAGRHEQTAGSCPSPRGGQPPCRGQSSGAWPHSSSLRLSERPRKLGGNHARSRPRV